MSEFSKQLTTLVVPINGAKCQHEDSMLKEFYDKLDMPYHEYMTLDGLDDWLSDLTWIKDKYPQVKNILIYIFNEKDFLSSNPEKRAKLFKDFSTEEYWGDYQKEYGFQVSVLTSEDAEVSSAMADERAAVIYAEGFAKRVYGLDIIAGCECADFYLFTAGDGERVMYGTPHFVINKKTFDVEFFQGTLTDLLEIAKKGKKISIK